jgi:biotin synthase
MNGIEISEALELLAVEGAEMHELFARASAARYEHHGNRVRLCGIVNAKSGGCPEDCAFCAQSAHAKTDVERYGLLDSEGMVEAARRSEGHGAARFGIVTSGRSVWRDKEIETIAEAVTTVGAETGMEPCASLGHLSPDALRRLKEAGLGRYHHNLETAESYFPEICTTRRYSDAFETILAAKEAGLSVCSGGIFGMGEDPAQRIELLAKLRELDVDSVPLNFLQPIPGTRLEGREPLPALDCLKAVAVARLMMPPKEIRVCGGREHNLRDLQSWIFVAGADGMMVGGYLTVSGRGVEDDLQMIRDAGMVPVGGAAGS